MRGCFTLRQRKILLRSIFGSCGRSIGISIGWLEREEAFEDALGLPFGGVGEIDPHVHTTGAAESGV